VRVPTPQAGPRRQISSPLCDELILRLELLKYGVQSLFQIVYFGDLLLQATNSRILCRELLLAYQA
jgi:hypothetical protein